MSAAELRLRFRPFGLAADAVVEMSVNDVRLIERALGAYLDGHPEAEPHAEQIERIRSILCAALSEST